MSMNIAEISKIVDDNLVKIKKVRELIIKFNKEVKDFESSMLEHELSVNELKKLPLY